VEDAAANAKWVADQKECREAFKRDLLADLGIADHPKADRLFELAWDYGHASGYSEVYNYALELVDLLNP
jgi:hypothetical protein